MSKLAHAASAACCKQLEPWCSRHGYTVDVHSKETVVPATNCDKIEYVVTIRGYLNDWSFSAIILHFDSRGVSANWISDGLDRTAVIIYSKPSFFEDIEDIEDIVSRLSCSPGDVVEDFMVHCNVNVVHSQKGFRPCTR